MRRTRIRPNCVAPATERPPTAEHGPRHRHSGVVALGERDLRRSIQPARSLATQTSNIRYARSWYQVGVGRGTTGPSIDRWSSVYWLRGHGPEDSSFRRQAQGCGRADTRHLALRADGNEAPPTKPRTLADRVHPRYSRAPCAMSASAVPVSACLASVSAP